MKRYFKKYMLYVVAALITLVIVYGVVDRMIVDVITVSYDGKTIVLHELEEGYGSPFVAVVEQMSSIPYLPLGTEMVLDFNNFKVDQFEVNDYILTTDGKIRFNGTFSESESISIHSVNDTYYLTLNENMMIFLSSATEDKIYRGIEIVITTEEKTTSYLYVIETDAFEDHK